MSLDKADLPTGECGAISASKPKASWVGNVAKWLGLAIIQWTLAFIFIGIKCYLYSYSNTNLHDQLLSSPVASLVGTLTIA